ncbi:MAG TPA: adenylate/guanylate cyclase domain-containing protein [Oligoflexus sp.]|uniref:adenylate/guanylate cyclase domain-containing protein n=1 Tax=Oligoflexus sp. TaxID=1971216 RepID=UPI002D221AB6|nr:adenylate/guanylate cyclase domain-containing protein [Oligoflexus sp.]HYX35986.1 adenylate/guanylate cyclase domain-containing protein [Oligoflexus sp.]
MQHRILWIPAWLLLLSLLGASPAQANELSPDMSLSELEYEIADHPRRVNEWARPIFATMDRSKAPDQWVKILATIFLSSSQMGEDRAVTASQYKKEVDDALGMSRQIRAWQEYDIFQSLANQLKFGADFDAFLVEELKLLNFLFKSGSIDVALIRLSQIANTLSTHGRRAAARKYANQAKLILKENKDISEFRRESIHVTIALILMEDPDMQKNSEELFENATKIFKKNGRRHLLAQTTYNYAANTVFQGQSLPEELQRAIGYLELGIAAAHQINDAPTSGLSRALLGHALNRLRKFSEAETVALEAIAFLHGSHDLGTISASIAAGTAEIELKKYDQAKINLTRAEELVEEIPSTPLYLRVELKKNLSQLSFANQSFDKAFRYQIEYYYLDSEWTRQGKKASLAAKRNLGFTGDDDRLADEEQHSDAYASWAMGLSLVVSLSCLALVYRKNRMIRKLEADFETQTLKRSFHPKLVEEFMLGRSTLDETSHSRIVTILFADLVDFGNICDKLGSERATRLLNQYFSKMSAIVFDHEAMLDKFTGHGVMVVFGVPHQTAPREQAIRALHCGIEMMQALTELNTAWKKEFGFSITMRTGLSQGEAVVGSFGTESRKEYTAVGSTVQLAAALQEHAESGQILLSQTVAQFFSEDCEQIGELVAETDGKPMPVFVYPWQLESEDKTLDVAG